MARLALKCIFPRWRNASEVVRAATIAVRNSDGHRLIIFETWKSVGWLSAEREFKLATGEAVEQLAEDVFVLLATNETLRRIRHHAPISLAFSQPAPERATTELDSNGQGDRRLRAVTRGKSDA
jgi:hypothetical protein